MATSESGAAAAASNSDASSSAAPRPVPARSPPPGVSVTPAASPPSRPPLGAATSAASSRAASPAASLILQRPANAAAPRLSPAAHSSLAVALARPPPLVRRTLSGSKGASTSAELSDATATGASGSLLLSAESGSEATVSASVEPSAAEEAGRPGLTTLPSGSGQDLASRLRHAIEGDLPSVSVDEADGSSEADAEVETAGQSSHDTAQEANVARVSEHAASDAEATHETTQPAASSEQTTSSEPSADTGWGWSTLTTLPSMPPSLKITAPSLKRLGLGGYSASNEASDASSIESTPGPSGLRRWWSAASSPVSSDASAAAQASSSAAPASKAQPPQPKLPRGSFPVSKPRKKSSAAPLAAGESKSGRAEASSSRAPADAADAEAQAKAKAREERRRRREQEKMREQENISETDLSEPHALGAILPPGDGEPPDTSSSQPRFTERQYYVLSAAGKPVYVSTLTSARLARADAATALRRRQDPSTDGPSEELAALLKEHETADDLEDEAATMRVAVMQALVSNYAGVGGNKLQEASREVLELAPREQVTYLLRPPLYLVCISAWGEAESTRRSHLEYLHYAIVSLVSGSQLSRLFARAANFDLRRLLEGTDGLLDSLVRRLQKDPAVPLGALQPLRLTPALRDDVGSLLGPARGVERPKDVLYVLLLARQRIVTLARPRRHSVHPVDCQLLINTVYGTKALRESGTESWVPICLPKFAPQGFVYAHVSFLDANDDEDAAPAEAKPLDSDTKQPDLALVLVTGNPSGFSELSAWRKSILSSLQTTGLLPRLLRALPASPYSADDMGIPGLRHFIFKWRANVQLTAPRFEAPYAAGSEAQQRLLTLYNVAHDTVHGRARKARARARAQDEEQSAAAAAKGTPAAAPKPAEEPKRGVPTSVLVSHPPARGGSTVSSSHSRAASDELAAPASSSSAPQMHICRTSHEAVLAWVTPPFELYMAAGPNLPRGALVAAASAVASWVKANEAALFLISSPTL